MTAVHITLQRNLIGALWIPVAAEAAAQRIPIVCAVSADETPGRAHVEILRVRAVVRILIYRAAVSQIAEASKLVAATCGCQARLGVSCRLSDDVDDAVHSVSAPQRCSGAADHFNPIDVLEHH